MTETAAPTATPGPSNVDVGARIGLNHSTVSRIRGGHRIPSLIVMLAISREYGWSVDEQAAAVAAGTYSDKFEEILLRSVGR